MSIRVGESLAAGMDRWRGNPRIGGGDGIFGRRGMQMKTGTTEPGKTRARSRTRRKATADPATERCRMIAEAAYYRAQERNFHPATSWTTGSRPSGTSTPGSSAIDPGSWRGPKPGLPALLATLAGE
jgi:hypothetical protein